MTWGTFSTIMTVAGFASILLFGPSWYRKWVLTCFAAVAATGLIVLGVAVLVDEPVDDGVPVDNQRVLPVGDWVAVYHVDDLPEREHMSFIEAAGFDVFHAVASCWTGLPAELGVGPDRQILGVWGRTEDKLREAMGRVPGDPVLIVQARNVCPSD